MKLFKQGRISKTYWAVVRGGPAEDEGFIDLPLGRLDATRGWWMKVDPMGQPAQTRWRVLGRSGDFCWLELKPLTGRTHQLRVHCAALDFPIFGDPVYGFAAPGESLHLHARAISIPISANKPAVVVEACVPGHMKVLLADCGWTPAMDEAVVMTRLAREAEQVFRAQEFGASSPVDA